MIEQQKLKNNTEQKGMYNPFYEHDNCGAGFVCSLEGERTNDTVHLALEILDKLEHRGAVSADGKTGDGAGILIEVPHELFKNSVSFELPERNEYAVGQVFLPQKENQRNWCQEVLENSLEKANIKVLGWRKVPVDREFLGPIAAKTEPVVEQIFVAKGDESQTDEYFKAQLYYARKISEHTIWGSKLIEKNYFYLPSFSTHTIIYKGLLMPEDISNYFLDLNNKELITRFALVHQRFSTNTFPTWDLAQPFRYMCHNGEINTLRGNVSRMRAREELFASELFTKEQIEELNPIVLDGKSDSATMDMVVELLLHTGRTLPEVMMMMVPEAWEHHDSMTEDKKDFYKFHSCIMEPWDGPASIPFTDGQYIGAVLDRNGLRPSRYTVTKNGYVIMSSEVGVIKIAPENVSYHGRLEPGKIFLVDMEAGKILSDEEVKKEIVNKNPYSDWMKDHLLTLEGLEEKNTTFEEEIEFLDRLKIFGYTKEDFSKIILPMINLSKEPIGSMGVDTPLAVFSQQPQLLFNYFKQLFAQVTNPPLDGIREKLVTDFAIAIGKEENIFDNIEDHAKKLVLQNPVLSVKELAKIESNTVDYLQAEKISILYTKSEGVNGLENKLEEIVSAAEKAIKNNKVVVILSDRGVNEQNAAIPSLLATSYLHHELQRRGKRSQISIVVESAEVREIHHYAMLFGYGASAVNPYMIEDIIQDLIKTKKLDLSAENSFENYRTAVATGVIKVMNKIGISTLKSYRSSQIFEAVGIDSVTMKKYFPYTASRIEGIGLNEIEREVSERHSSAFERDIDTLAELESGGNYQWRRQGEKHQFNPLTVAKLQQAVRQNKPLVYKQYADLINEQNKQLMTIRGLLDFKDHDPIPLDEVEPWTDIVKRFKTGAMSYGSISQEAHENLAIAMNRMGGKSNSGEGGEFAERFQKDLNGDLRNSAIKQVASGRFGVSINYLTNAKEIQIKMAQGAKPGEGGQLPGEKVFPKIADCRNSTPYVGLISPPPHHDIYSIEDLSQLIYDLKNANRAARVNVKLVSEVGVGTIAAGVAKAKADVILISGFDGGTGASPLTSLRHCGLPWELGLAEAQQTLVMNDLRGRVVVECDGQMKTGRDVAIAALLGAEEFGFATAPLVASGCVMMRVCHLNTCPVGIATQDPELRKKFNGKPEHVINYFYFVAEELRKIMANLGFRTLDEMVGKVDKLETKIADGFYKTRGINLDKILHKVDIQNVPVKNVEPQDHGLESNIDFDILEQAHMALMRKTKTKLTFDINNENRSVGAILSNEISKIYGADGLPENTLTLEFNGSAGQSFGVFAAKGINMIVHGNTNDYLGKGLSGAKLIIKKPKNADFKAEDNIITGNVTLYGATAGEVYINGKAGERFCVRNSGAQAVVEGIGDHGCEYMTGGTAVILGDTGRNFGAGMSGGIAYVLAESDAFKNEKCNLNSVDLYPVESNEDKEQLRNLIQNHLVHTESERAKYVLENWDAMLPKFIKVFPTEYKKALERLANEDLIQA